MRNHIAQSSIEAAEKGDFCEARMLLKILENPFSEEPVDKILSEFDQDGKHFWLGFFNSLEV